MNWAASTGQMKQSTVDEFNQASKGLKLPKVTKPRIPRKSRIKDYLSS